MRESLDRGGLGGTTRGKVEVLPRWERCVVIASGPSAPDSLDGWTGGWPVIAVNNSWRLWPSADILYACDRKWWEVNEGAPGFKGLKVSVDQHIGKTYPDIIRVWSRHATEFQFGRPGEIAGGGNSGFQALNLAVSLGCKTVALVGFDMRLDRGSHWHGDHPTPLHNPDTPVLAHWRHCFDQASKKLTLKRIKVWNCSPVSALECFEKADLCSIAKA